MSRVLVVDDEPDVLLMLRVNLEAAGYETVLAADGEMALKRIAEARPDVVVLDVMMPVMDGWGVLKSLQGEAGAPPVIVVSVKSSDRDKAIALSLGAAVFVSKPFDPQAVVAEVAWVLDASASDRDDRRHRALEAVGGPVEV